MYTSSSSAGEVRQFGAQVALELRQLQRRPVGAWAQWSNAAVSITPPDLRERVRLERLEREERQARGERTRERVAREQTRPWREQDRWGLRKRVWQERRDRDRAVLDQRERVLLQSEQQLGEELRSHMDWLQELQELDPSSTAWCAEQAQHIAQEEITTAMWEELWARRRSAAQRRARDLLARADVRAELHELNGGDRYAFADALTARLLAAIEAGRLTMPRLPVLFAALALLLTPSEGHSADHTKDT